MSGREFSRRGLLACGLAAVLPALAVPVMAAEPRRRAPHQPHSRAASPRQRSPGHGQPGLRSKNEGAIETIE